MAEHIKVVTIDGPSGVGKSTVSRKLAARLGYTYLDTGAMYRAVALCCQENSVSPENEDAVGKILAGLDLKLLPARSEKDDVRVLVNGKEVGEKIRTPEISMIASAVSALPSVRRHLTAMQQELGSAGQVVAEGRDTGTVVFPNAAWKFYLDADPEERARRRIKQLRGRGESPDEKEILDQILRRDRDDSERTIAPLKAAPDAVLINSTDLQADDVIEMMFNRVKGK